MFDVLSQEGKYCTTRTYKRYSLTDIHVMLSTVEALVRQPSYVSLEILVSLVHEIV